MNDAERQQPRALVCGQMKPDRFAGFPPRDVLGECVQTPGARGRPDRPVDARGDARYLNAARLVLVVGMRFDRAPQLRAQGLLAGA